MVSILNPSFINKIYVKVANTTHMHIKQLSTENNLQVVDQFWLIKDKHGPYQSKVYIITMFYPFYMSGAQFLISTMKLTIFVFLIVCLYTLLKSNIRALAYVRSRNLHMQPYTYWDNCINFIIQLTLYPIIILRLRI